MIRKGINSKGNTYYYNEDKKRFTNEKEFVKANLNKITNGQIKYTDLSKKGKLAYKANSRNRVNGKFIDNKLAEDIRNIYNKGLNKDERPLRKGDDFGAILGDKTDEIIKQISTKTKFVENDKYFKTSSEIFNVQKDLTERIKKGEDVKVKVDGKIYYGLDAIFKLSEYESKRRKKMGKNLIFIHQIQSSFDTKSLQYTHFLDTSETIEISSE